MNLEGDGDRHVHLLRHRRICTPQTSRPAKCPNRSNEQTRTARIRTRGSWPATPIGDQDVDDEAHEPTTEVNELNWRLTGEIHAGQRVSPQRGRDERARAPHNALHRHQAVAHHADLRNQPTNQRQRSRQMPAPSFYMRRRKRGCRRMQRQNNARQADAQQQHPHGWEEPLRKKRKPNVQHKF